MCTHEPMSSPFPVPNTLARVAPPTAHRNLPEIINHLSVPVDTSDARIPEVLRPVLDRALHPDPAQRYRNGNELAEALTNDPQVKAACTSDYAERYGLDLSTSYTINTLGPGDQEWEAGNRGFACVLGRLL